MTHKTTVWLEDKEWDALLAATKSADRTQSYLIRKAIYAVFVLKLVDINALPQMEETEEIPA
jgi:hypothetical protein